MTNCTDLKSPGTWDLAEEAGTLAVFAALVDAPRAWSDDEDPNAPWLPKIPRPRVSPVPPVRIPRQPEGAAPLVAEDDKKPTVPGQRIPAKVPKQPVRQQAGVPSCMPSAARPCSSCEGKGGRVVDTSSGGVIRKHWSTCKACRGTGEC